MMNSLVLIGTKSQNRGKLNKTLKINKKTYNPTKINKTPNKTDDCCVSEKKKQVIFKNNNNNKLKQSQKKVELKVIKIIKTTEEQECSKATITGEKHLQGSRILFSV